MLILGGRASVQMRQEVGWRKTISATIYFCQEAEETFLASSFLRLNDLQTEGKCSNGAGLWPQMRPRRNAVLIEGVVNGQGRPFSLPLGASHTASVDMRYSTMISPQSLSFEECKTNWFATPQPLVATVVYEQFKWSIPSAIQLTVNTLIWVSNWMQTAFPSRPMNTVRLFFILFHKHTMTDIGWSCCVGRMGYTCISVSQSLPYQVIE